MACRAAPAAALSARGPRAAGSPLPPAALAALAAPAGAARGRLSLGMEVDLAPGRPGPRRPPRRWPPPWPVDVPPPRPRGRRRRASEEALRGGWLEGLAAFAAFVS
eukprot:tig00000147_g9512.t1